MIGDRDPEFARSLGRNADNENAVRDMLQDGWQVRRQIVTYGGGAGIEAIDLGSVAHETLSVSDRMHCWGDPRGQGRLDRAANRLNN
jgi:hypothetical protein